MAKKLQPCFVVYHRWWSYLFRHRKKEIERIFWLVYDQIFSSAWNTFFRTWRPPPSKNHPDRKVRHLTIVSHIIVRSEQTNQIVPSKTLTNLIIVEVFSFSLIVDRVGNSLQTSMFKIPCGYWHIKMNASLNTPRIQTANFTCNVQYPSLASGQEVTQN